jgi:hypothetical protein
MVITAGMPVDWLLLDTDSRAIAKPSSRKRTDAVFWWPLS